MQNAFVQVRGDQIILDKSDSILYGSIAVAAILFVIVIAIAVKKRKKNFIKTLPTQLKDGV